MPKHQYEIPVDDAPKVAQALGHILEKLIAKANSRNDSEFRISPERLIQNAQSNVQGFIDNALE